MSEEFDLYEVGGYGTGKIGFGNTLGIVSVDMMNCVTNTKAPMGRSPMGQDAVENCSVLFETARKNGVPIVHCQTAFQADFSDMPPWKVACMKEWILGSWEVEIDQRLWREGDVLVCKKTPSIFFGTHCASIMNMHGVDTIIVTGANTSGCIRATSIDSFALGYKTIVPEECVYDQGSVAHRQNLEDIGKRYVDVEPFEIVHEHVKTSKQQSA